jgi:peptidoglycan-N-acetylglucosamine deacetylase
MSIDRLRSAVGAAIPRRLAVRRLRRAATSSVLLTFDDGPDKTVTPAVLDRLDAYQVRGVFFVIGHRAEECPELLHEIAGRGHILGNHSYTHSDTYFAPHRPPPLREFRADVARCQAILDPILRDGPRLFRPPGGRLTVSTMLTAQLLGLKCIVWSKRLSDWEFRCDDEGRAGGAQLVGMIRPADIVLLHDDHPTLLALLDVLLPGLMSRGLELSSGARYL